MPVNMKDTIAEAFLAMTARKSIDKITVKDLVRPATSPGRPFTTISRTSWRSSSGRASGWSSGLCP